MPALEKILIFAQVLKVVGPNLGLQTHSMKHYLKPAHDMSYEYTIKVPSNERAAFRLMARKMGWEVTGPKRLSAYERSKLEAHSGKVHCFNSLEEMFSSLNA